ncbi:hybrid sensor histidine kinase/response regulator [Robbsia andropogonis]|uniref:hybrid sensor histidine kinase/response regulator n=1 Tax=Robbsia andropogonis TaxID=28092 RepID=UPI000467BF4C|nr:hybrid sensor histidine kinase/response regulator [Robbsia andropogonis]
MTAAIKILLVDDVGQNLVALDALLRREDVLPLHATNGTAALELLLEHDIALALIDVQMPEMDGFELAELMRGSPRTRNVPIIFLTATDRDTRRMFKGYEAGAVDFLYKPFDPHILRSKAEVFIQLHQQKRQLAAQLESMKQLIRTNDMFVAVLGHDLRNPLASIMTNAEIVRRAVPLALPNEGRLTETEQGIIASAPYVPAQNSERLVTASERIIASGKRMAHMIDQLLDVARVRSGQLQFKPEPLDLQSVTQAIIDEFQSAEFPPTLRLMVMGDTHGVWDRGGLAQILSNLIGNALRHGDDTQPVSIELDGSGAEAIRLRVSNGGLIPETVQPHLFTPFRSGKNTHYAPTDIMVDTLFDAAAGTSNAPMPLYPSQSANSKDVDPSGPVNGGQSEGLGLGLFIVYELVRLHTGTIEARSVPGNGTTTFEVTLPRRARWRGIHNGVDMSRRDPAAACDCAAQMATFNSESSSTATSTPNTAPPISIE